MSDNQTVITAAELELARRPMTRAVVIAAGESISTALDKTHHGHMVIFLPAGWTTASITFLGSETVDGTFNQIVSSTDVSEVNIPSVVASKVIVLDTEFLESFIAVPFIKIRSGTLVAPVNQGVEVSINIVLRR